MKIVFMGDSLTQGYGIDINQRFSNQLAIDSVNSGISGDTTGGMLARFHTMVIQHQPTHVFIMGGTNDVFLQVDHRLSISNILAMCRYARYHNITPIVGIPLPVMGQVASQNSYGLSHDQAKIALEAYVRDLMHLCQDDGLAMVDFYTDFRAEWMLEDGVHPNEAGHQYMANILKSFLESEYND